MAREERVDVIQVCKPKDAKDMGGREEESGDETDLNGDGGEEGETMEGEETVLEEEEAKASGSE